MQSIVLNSHLGRSIFCRRLKREYIARLSISIPTSHRQSFGSFHSDDIDQLIRQDSTTYQVPEIYKKIQLENRRDIEEVITPNDASLKLKLFQLDNQWTFINHGAFGAALNILSLEAFRWRNLCESQPLLFFDRLLLPMIVFSVRSMARFINCPATELLPLQNVTSGLNAVVNSMTLNKGDEVMCFSLTYGSTKKILKDLCSRTGATLKILHLSLPIESAESIVAKIEASVSEKTKLVIIDHITSNTAMELPIIEIASVFKRMNATVVIDAAHSLLSQHVSIYNGQISASAAISHQHDEQASPTPLSIADVADVWISNGHKWLSTPKGCAFMWVSPKMGARLRPPVISHGFIPHTESIPSPRHSETAEEIDSAYIKDGRLLSAYSWDGCRDYSALLTAPSAIEFWQSFSHSLGFVSSSCRQETSAQGSESMVCATSQSDQCGLLREMNRKLLAEATEMLAQEWHLADEDFAAPISMRQASPMSLVPLPAKVCGVDTRSGTTDTQAFQLQELLHHDYNIEVPIKCLEGRLYTRISAHIYNSIADYERLASVMSALAKK